MKPQLLILTEFVISLVAGRPQLPESRDAPGSGLNFIDETEFPQLALYFEDWILNDLYLNCLRSSPDELYKCNYKFHWYDPNFDEATDCNTTFHWDGVTLTSGPNNTYNKWNVVCSMDFPEIWQFSFDTVWSAWSFNMTLSRIHKDPKDFGPQNYPEFFAMPNVAMQAVQATDYNMSFVRRTPLNATIQGLAM